MTHFFGTCCSRFPRIHLLRCGYARAPVVSWMLTGALKSGGVAGDLVLAGPSPPSRQLLHFGAVDWQMEVYINSIWVGSHEGAYDSFFFDITDALLATSGGGTADEVLVQVAMDFISDYHLPEPCRPHRRD